MESRRYLKIYVMKLRAFTMIRAVSPMNFFAMIVSTLLAGLVALVFVKVIFSFATDISGWNFNQALLVIASFQIIEALVWMTTAQFAGLRKNVNSGGFDYFMIKPINILFSVATWRVDPEDIGRFLTAFALIAIGANGLGLTTLELAIKLPFFILTILCGYFVSVSFSLAVNSTFFWFIEAGGINNMLDSLLKTGQYPTDILFGRAAKFIASTIFPIAFLGTVPAKIFIYGPSFALIAGSIVAAVVMFVSALLIFKAGLRVYSSASS